jgi:hypothetical protein
MSAEDTNLTGDSHAARESLLALRRVALLSFGIDVALVTVFAALGRSSHAREATILGLWTTACPFLFGLTVIWVSARLWRRPLLPVFAGLSAWSGTVLIGLATRFLIVGSVAIAFVLVAIAVLGLFLVGWRLVVQVVRRARQR